MLLQVTVRATCHLPSHRAPVPPWFSSLLHRPTRMRAQISRPSYFTVTTPRLTQLSRLNRH
jgi:hypothetical protein